MWISWVNPRTNKPERKYNYFDPDTEDGKKAIENVSRALSEKFNIPQAAIPGFHVEEAPWLPPSKRHSDEEV